MSELLKIASNLGEMRQKLFDLPIPFALTKADWAELWPFVDNIYANLKKTKYGETRGGYIPHYYQCRLKRFSPPSEKSVLQPAGSSPKISKRKRRTAQECDVQFKIHEYDDYVEFLWITAQDGRSERHHSHDLDKSDAKKRNSALRRICGAEVVRGMQPREVIRELRGGITGDDAQALKNLIAAGGKYLTRADAQNAGISLRNGGSGLAKDWLLPADGDGDNDVDASDGSDNDNDANNLPDTNNDVLNPRITLSQATSMNQWQGTRLPDTGPRKLTLAEWTSARLLSPPNAACNVLMVNASTIAKTGKTVHPSEAAAMRLVRSKTTIPVPQVISTYTIEETQQCCILMERIEGDVLSDVWDAGTAAWQNSIIKQLKGFMNELRSIRGNFIGGADGSPCTDQFFPPGEEYGPYVDRNFYAGLVKAMKARQESPWVDMVAEFIHALPPHEIVFTHNDFTPRNIIVRGSKVVAIVNWGLAGFYPAYWEYVKALYRPDWMLGWYRDKVVDRILRSYQLEQAVLLHTRTIVG